MYAFLAFLITIGELVLVVGSYILKSQNIFYTSLVYGSPFYLIMNLLNSDSAFLDKTLLYVGLLLFHLFKYALFFIAQMRDERGVTFYCAILFEAVYLGLSGYYIN